MYCQSTHVVLKISYSRSGARIMQFQRIVCFPTRIAYSHIFLIVCCLALLCAGCADALGNAPSSPSPTPGHVNSPPITQSIAKKSDANGFPSEGLLRRQLAKVQSIMQGMTL